MAWGTDAASRWLSLVSAWRTVVCVWGIGRQLVDDNTGLAAAFIAGDPAAPRALFAIRSAATRCSRSSSPCRCGCCCGPCQSDRPRDWAAFAVASILGAYIALLLRHLSGHQLADRHRHEAQVWIGKRAFWPIAAIAVGGLPLLAFAAWPIFTFKRVSAIRSGLLSGVARLHVSDVFHGRRLGPVAARAP